MWIPDPRFENPGLLVPNRAPIGDVVIDQSNPFGRGLIRCWIPRMGVYLRDNAGPGYIYDLTGSGIVLRNQETIPSRDIELKIEGEAPTIWPKSGGSFEGQVQGASINNAIDLTADIVNFSADDAWTVITRMTQTEYDVSNTYRYIIGGSNGDFAWNRSGVFVRVKGTNESKDLPSLGVVSNQRFITHGVSLTGGGAGNSILRGYQHENQAFEEAASGMDSTFSTQFRTANYSKGQQFCMVWNRAFTETEFQAFCANPYQVLIPA